MSRSPSAPQGGSTFLQRDPTMRTHKKLALLTTALFTIGGLTFAGCNKDESASTNPPPTSATPAASPTPGQKVGSAIDSTTQQVAGAATQAAAAISPTGANSLDGARNAVKGVIENALTRNNFKDVASYFTKADDDRVVNTKPETKDLDDQIDAFNTAWKNKYGYSFKIKDLNFDYPDTFIHFEQDSADPTKATGIIAANQAIPEVKIPFVQQGGLWRINIPDTVDGNVLHTNLLAAITSLNQNATTWPASDLDAAQTVTRSIIAAVMNQK